MDIVHLRASVGRMMPIWTNGSKAPSKCNGISHQMRTMLGYWTDRPVRAGCYSWAALSLSDFEDLVPIWPKRGSKLSVHSQAPFQE